MAGVPLLGSSLLGALTFCAKEHSAGDCDSKGLPLTLNTTNILGKFQRLKTLSHPNLACYLEAQKLKNGEHKNPIPSQAHRRGSTLTHYTPSLPASQSLRLFPERYPPSCEYTLPSLSPNMTLMKWPGEAIPPGNTSVIIQRDRILVTGRYLPPRRLKKYCPIDAM